MRITRRASPNCGPRRDGQRPAYVVLHYTAMASAEAAITWLCDPNSQVSAHYVICKTGAITRLVPEDMRAWHAGQGSWQGKTDMNSASIGIELDNDGQSPFTPALMTSLIWLLPQILDRWQIPPAHVIGHSDLAPGRKIDPGPLFDWQALARAGLATPRARRAIPLDATWDIFRQTAKRAGYTAEVDDQTLLTATRLRWRPYATGPLVPQDIAALPAL